MTNTDIEPQVSRPSWLLAILIAVVGIGGLWVLVRAAYRKPQPQPAAPAPRQYSSASDHWIDEIKLSPAPTPMATASPQPSPQASPGTYQTYTQSQAVGETTYQQSAKPPTPPAVLAALNVNNQTLEVPHTTESDTLNVKLAPLPPHSIAAFTWIPGTLQTPIDSDHSGDVIGRVSVDVRDSLTGTEALIPAGSILHGWHDGRAALDQNDESLQVVWRDIEIPGRKPFHLPDMPGGDAEGQPGFSELINHHYLRSWIPAILTAGISAGANLATQPTYASTSGYSPLQMAIGSGTQTLSSQAISQLARNLGTVKPTIRIEAGYKFVVLCTKNLVFDDGE